MKTYFNFMLLLVVLVFMVYVPAGNCARPLSTDDAGTVDKGHFEAEIGYDYIEVEAEEEQGVGFSLKYGLTTRLDIGAAIPYGLEPSEEFGDWEFGTKLALIKEHNFFPDLSFSFSYRTGEEDKKVGHRCRYCGIITKEFGGCSLHLNCGYDPLGEEEGDDGGVYSAALEIPCSEFCRLVGEVGYDCGAAEGLVGCNYQLTDYLTADLGFGWGLNKEATDIRTTIGITLGF